jgi:Aspartic acid proteinase inhibitor
MSKLGAINYSSGRFNVKKSLPVVMIFLALYLTLGGGLELAAQQPTVGGYEKAPKDDPAIVSAAKFAVNEQQQKQGGSISLVSVQRAETQLVAGINYRLCLKVKVDGANKKVTVVVNKTLEDRYTLTSWEPGGCKKR